jgi:plastocyanin
MAKQNQLVDINPILNPTQNQRAQFVPQNTQPYAVGDAVFWRNNDPTLKHQPKPVDGADDDWTDPIPTNSTSYRCPTFGSAGTYDYVCALHSGEKGTITVK